MKNRFFSALKLQRLILFRTQKRDKRIDIHVWLPSPLLVVVHFYWKKQTSKQTKNCLDCTRNSLLWREEKKTVLGKAAKQLTALKDDSKILSFQKVCFQQRLRIFLLTNCPWIWLAVKCLFTFKNWSRNSCTLSHTVDCQLIWITAVLPFKSPHYTIC